MYIMRFEVPDIEGADYPLPAVARRGHNLGHLIVSLVRRQPTPEIAPLAGIPASETNPAFQIPRPSEPLDNLADMNDAKVTSAAVAAQDNLRAAF